MRWAVARRLRTPAGLMPAVLLAAALALATPVVVDAAPSHAAKHGPHSAQSSSVAPSTSHGHGRHGNSAGPPPGHQSRPGNAAASSPAAALHPVTFVDNAVVATTVGRAVPPAQAAAPRQGGSAPTPAGVDSILALPQGSLLGDSGSGARLAAFGPWQAILGAEGVALVVLVVTMLRRRRVAGRREVR